MVDSIVIFMVNLYFYYPFLYEYLKETYHCYNMILKRYIAVNRSFDAEVAFLN